MSKTTIFSEAEFTYHESSPIQPYTLFLQVLPGSDIYVNVQTQMKTLTCKGN